MFSSMEKEINTLVAEKRKGSVAVVLTSVCVAAGFGFSLWKDDEFKDIFIGEQADFDIKFVSSMEIKI